LADFGLKGFPKNLGHFFKRIGGLTSFLFFSRQILHLFRVMDHGNR